MRARESKNSAQFGKSRRKLAIAGHLLITRFSNPRPANSEELRKLFRHANVDCTRMSANVWRKCRELVERTRLLHSLAQLTGEATPSRYALDNNKSIESVSKASGQQSRASRRKAGGKAQNKNSGFETGTILDDRYILDCELDKGSFGRVLLCYDIQHQRNVAVKVLDRRTNSEEQALGEIQVLTRLNAYPESRKSGIIAFLRSFSHAQHHCLVFERLHMNLYQALKAGHFRGFTLRLTAFIGFQLLRALHFLARPDIRLVHCDLKPENVMLVCGGRPIVRLVDFGSARPVRPDDMAYAQSRFYRAPEVILGVPFDTAVDVWSLGVMLVELHTGQPLLPGKSDLDMLALIMELLGELPTRLLNDGHYTSLFFLQKGDGVHTLRARVSVPGQPKEQQARPFQPCARLLDDVLTGRLQPDTRAMPPPPLRHPQSDGHQPADYTLFRTLLEHMLQLDPEHRAQPAQALQHPALAKFRHLEDFCVK